MKIEANHRDMTQKQYYLQATKTTCMTQVRMPFRVPNRSILRTSCCIYWTSHREMLQRKRITTRENAPFFAHRAFKAWADHWEPQQKQTALRKSLNDVHSFTVLQVPDQPVRVVAEKILPLFCKAIWPRERKKDRRMLAFALQTTCDTAYACLLHYSLPSPSHPPSRM